jgi:hypothetical protein
MSGPYAFANPYIACAGGALVTGPPPNPGFVVTLGALPQTPPIINNSCPVAKPANYKQYLLYSGGGGWQAFCPPNRCITNHPTPQTTVNGCSVAVYDCVPYTATSCIGPGRQQQ